MENAARALIMAASVLLGVLLLLVMIYVFRAGAKVNETYDRNQQSHSMELYNSKFEFYDKDNNTIIDMISLVNLAYDVNTDSNYDEGYAVRIEIEINGQSYVVSNINRLSSRNKIFKGDTTDEISIYELINKSLSETDPTDTLSTTRLENGKTIYKYLFEVTNPEDFTYNDITARVSSIKLTGYVNPEW